MSHIELERWVDIYVDIEADRKKAMDAEMRKSKR